MPAAVAERPIEPVDVSRIALEQIRRGEHPTVESVRREFGGGSPNRVLPALKRFYKEELPPLLEPGAAAVATPNPLQALWDQSLALAREQAQAELKHERQALTDQAAEVAAARDRLAAELRELGQREAALQELALQLTANQRAAQDSVREAEQRAGASAAAQQLADQRTREALNQIAELSDRLKARDQELATGREASALERERLQGQVDRLRQEAAQAAEHAHKEQASALERLAQVRSERDACAHRCAELDAKLGAQVAQSAAAAQELALATQTNDSLRRDCDSAKADLNTEQQAHRGTRTSLAAIEDRLAARERECALLQAQLANVGRVDEQLRELNQKLTHLSNPKT